MSPKRAEVPGERFVMCPPKYMSTKIANNVWMKNEPVNIPRAMAQYTRAKRVIESFGTQVLEIPPVEGCQDQTYVANIGIALKPYIVLANYKAEGRDCEVPPARQFFRSLGYATIQPPFYFEGEADLKKLTEEVYIGGWGKFTDPKALDWIEEQTGISIIRVKEVSDQLYHLDCSIFVVNEENILLTEAGLDDASVRSLEHVANLHTTPPDIASTGITNGVKIPGKPIYMSGTFQPETKEYRKAMEWILKFFDQFGWSVVLMDTDEADKSGADLSCMVMHLDF